MSKTPREFSKSLRRNQTAAEKKLWQELRSRRCGGYKFRRQYIIDEYVVDFVCISKKLVVEVDGTTHEGREDYDQNRTEYIRQRGYDLSDFQMRKFWMKPMQSLKVSLMN